MPLTEGTKADNSRKWISQANFHHNVIKVPCGSRRHWAWVLLKICFLSIQFLEGQNKKKSNYTLSFNQRQISPLKHQETTVSLLPSEASHHLNESSLRDNYKYIFLLLKQANSQTYTSFTYAKATKVIVKNFASHLCSSFIFFLFNK